MQRLIINDKTVSAAGEFECKDSTVGFTITNDGTAAVNWSWNNDSKSRTLAEGESLSFGGIDDFVLGGNKFYYDFGTGTKKLTISVFTAGQVIDQPKAVVYQDQNC